MEVTIDGIEGVINRKNNVYTCLIFLITGILFFALIEICFVDFVSSQEEPKITTLPDGTKITTLPDGTKITNLPSGTNITNLPSGTNITNLPSGTNITNLPSGTNITNLPGGTNITNLPGGTNITNLPSGANITNLPDGTNITNLPDGTKVLKLPGGGLWNRLVEGLYSIIYGVLIFGVLISLVLFGIGFKTKNNLFYIAGAGTLLITGSLYFSSPSVETPKAPAIPTEPTQPEPEILSPMQQIDLLLTNANKSKDSGKFAAERLNLLNALDISIKNNLPEKAEIIETKLSNTTRREATEHRRAGNYSGAIESIDKSIEYNPDNPWAYIEGIINSEESENHDAAINYAKDLDEIELPAETVNDFPIDAQTVNEYKNYALNFNNNGTSIAQTAETKENIADAITSVKKGAEYLGEALTISETLDTFGIKNTPTETAVANLVSANNNLIVLQTQSGDFNAAINSANNTLKIIEEYKDIISDTTKSGVLSNTATVHALSGDYNSAIDYAKVSISINTDNAGANNVVASSLTALGGKENVIDALAYAQNAAELDPANEIYTNNLNTIQDAIANNDYSDIELNLGVSVIEKPKPAFLSGEYGTFDCADEIINLECDTEGCLCNVVSNIPEDGEEYVETFEGFETLLKVAKELGLNITSETLNASRKPSKPNCTLIQIRIKNNKTLPNTKTAEEKVIKEFNKTGEVKKFIPVADHLFFLEICKRSNGRYYITGRWVDVTRGTIVYYEYYIGSDLEEGLKKVLKTFKDKYKWDSK